MHALKPLARALAIATLSLPLLAAAQNVAIVNGKAVPKARLDFLIKQAVQGGQASSPQLELQARDQVVMREIFAQEAERRGLGGSADYRLKMELARQSILIGELFENHLRQNPITDDAAKAEYEQIKAKEGGTEYRARHILVEKEDDAKSLIAQIKGGAKFEDLAKKNSKDPGSGEKGGDLDFAKAESYVPEFGQAMSKLKKGEMTDTPVKSQFGYHIIKLEDSREAQFPSFDEVKEQVKQALGQKRMRDYQESLRKGAKTDYKFSGQP
jgi:peptidyl-prolyl cis-trans isomerase C